MVKTVLKIDGMMCGMCEAHMNDAIRKAFQVEKVSSSHTKHETEIVSEAPLDEALLEKTVAATGYELKGISSEPYEKKRFSLFGK
ncbi:MAG: ATPase P [Oscillospiraceae bacterium]|jgi:copper chaperone CopZ|nr:ATPase P [Oscillospiraceae bacterium]MBQ5468765.1 ATPase P [Oscillospiraceae bacterium]MBQ6029934.1 ATPase P [Oscillospiraceae bacterium]MBQ6281449.1 ATPase P [Oscillospiraceae bacterium]MEE3459325.1 cation transporter [Candidatus Faecousia sp.]